MHFFPPSPSTVVLNSTASGSRTVVLYLLYPIRVFTNTGRLLLYLDVDVLCVATISDRLSFSVGRFSFVVQLLHVKFSVAFARKEGSRILHVPLPTPPAHIFPQ